MILLVDNHDSYTFNLAHLIEKAAGTSPLVVRADEIAQRGVPELLADGTVTHVVISPGPGTPEAAADFAGARAVIEAAAHLPVLGVCLGHQGLALLAGAAIGRTEPQHGQVSTITHSGEGIFAGVPQGFNAVRYHSLHVADVPEGIEVHARSEDGVVQAIRVAGTRHWGVQFHPESVLTEHGEALLRNFFDPWRVLHRSIDGPVDCEAVYRTLQGAAGNSFWLDSATGQGFSIMGTDRGPLSAHHVWARGDAGPDMLAALDGELRQPIDTAGLPELPFTGGWVGYLGYEAAEVTLPDFSPRHRPPGPDAHFMRPQSFLVHDHAAQRTHAMVLYRGDAPDDVARELLDELLAAAQATGPEVKGASISKGSWRLTHGDYAARFARIKEALAAGESYEVCLTDTYTAHTDAEGIDLYSRLRSANPAPYSAFLALGGREILSSSPERFLTVRGGDVETKPIKGTISRDRDPQVLLDCAKTRAENLMIVDLLRNDLSRVCDAVEVPALMRVESFATVHQLVSTVTGTLRRGMGVVDLIRATFPGGSMTGAPKERTCAIIDSLEAGPRGVYSGAIGWLGFDGSADLSIVIRTAVKDGDTITVGAGGAIVWDSKLDEEYDEMLLKASAVVEGLS